MGAASISLEAATVQKADFMWPFCGLLFYELIFFSLFFFPEHKNWTEEIISGMLRPPQMSSLYLEKRPGISACES